MAGANEQTRRWVEVAEAGNVAEGEVHTYSVEGRHVAVARANGQLYAVQDICTHDDGPLGEGELDEFAIECPRHGARFDVRTGEVLRMPAIQPIDTFPVMERDGKILVAVPDEKREAIAVDDEDW